jgi:alpha-N-arabinofuranosidase
MLQKSVLIGVIVLGAMLASIANVYSATPTLKITTEKVCEGTISPFQYGQFIEYLCGLTPSIFDEEVFDGSFEGVPEYKVDFRKQIDRIEQPWYPDGAVHRGDFALDPVDPFNGKVSQRITQKQGDACTLGISQAEKNVKAGSPMRCSLYLRAKEIQQPVTVTLWGEGKVYATATFKPMEHWQRFETVLTPTESDTHATLTISFVGPGTLWIDQVSLMPSDNVFGWRRDAAEALKALKPGVIRFGGSTIEGFEWTDTIGNPDKRPPFTTCWGGLEPGNAGLDEFLKLCEWVGAEPLICVRFSGKQPKDAADEVEYVNGPSDSPMGKLRAANGRTEPYHVTYWQIGNELGDESYQKGVAAFCKAMKAVDPSIKLMGAFPSPGLVRNAGEYLDYICPHHYEFQNLARTNHEIADLTKMIAENAPGRNIRLGITEWNTTGGEWGLGRGMLWTLDNALWCSRYHNLMHRHCDMIEIANRSNLADSFCCGIIQTNNHDLFKTPTYYAQQLYAAQAGRYPLLVVDGDSSSDTALDVSATLSEDGKDVAIFVVNPTLTPQKRTIDLAACVPSSDAVHVWTLTDTAKTQEREAANSWREPQRIRPVESQTNVVANRCEYEFLPLSLTVLKVHCKAK